MRFVLTGDQIEVMEVQTRRTNLIVQGTIMGARLAQAFLPFREPWGVLRPLSVSIVRFRIGMVFRR